MLTHRYPYLPAVFWVLASTALWTLIFAAAKFAALFSASPAGALQITWLRFGGALLAALALVPLSGGAALLHSTRPLTHLLRALCGGGAALSITWASAHMPLVDATALGMTYGVLVTLLGALVLAERPGPMRLWAGGLGLLGAAAILLGRGAFQQALPPGPALAATGAAVLLAAEGLLIRILGQREKALTVIIHVCFFGFCLMAVPAWLTWQPITWRSVAICIALGPVALVAQYCTIRGYRAAPLSVVGPVDYTWLIFAALLGYVAFGERPAPATVAGGLMILAAGTLLARSR